MIKSCPNCHTQIEWKIEKFISIGRYATIYFCHICGWNMEKKETSYSLMRYRGQPELCGM